MFVYLHGISLTSTEHIARLLGYEGAVVGKALDRLERRKLLERSRPSQGVRFYQILAQADSGDSRYLQHLISVSETRAGRLLLAKHLKSGRRESVQQAQFRQVS